MCPIAEADMGNRQCITGTPGSDKLRHRGEEHEKDMYSEGMCGIFLSLF